MTEEIREKLHEWLDSQQEVMIQTLQDWIRIPSVKADPLPDAPFGTECVRALEMALSQAQNMGFVTENLANYIGYVEMGEGPLFGILAHLDVVPAGDGWLHGPFDARIENGRMFGRGTLDDKGPAVSALFAMAAIKELGIPLDKRVRLLLGTDEESGWGDIDYYRAHAEMPEMAISPDGEYPVVNVEKGILVTALEADWSQSGYSPLLKIEGGTRSNVVPGTAWALLSGFSFDELQGKIDALGEEEKGNYELVQENDLIRLTAKGKGAHASRPETGVNAISVLLQLLQTLDLAAANDAIEKLATAFPITGYDGRAAGVAMQDSVSGPLTANLGLISGENGHLEATIDMRIPVTASADMITTILGQTAGLNCRKKSFSEPHYVSENSNLVQSLLKVYRQESNLSPYCLAIGGGTYARAIDNAVTFGCLFPGEEDTMHQPEESVATDAILLNAKILAAAIVELCAAD